MPKYKITAVNETKGHVTYQILKNDGTVLLTDTRSDLPIDDKVEVDRILSETANIVAANARAVRRTDTALTAIVGTEQTARDSA